MHLGGRAPIIASLLAFLCSVPAHATTYYVSPAGNDANSGTLSSPWKTLAKANSVPRAGDTIYLRAGTYAEMLSPKNSGTPTQPITYKAYAGETVNIVGMAATDAAAEWSASYIRIEDLRIRKARRAPGYNNNVVIRGNGNILSHCKIVSPESSIVVHDEGVHERGINLIGSYNVIENSEIGNMTIGVALSDGHHNIIRNNNIHHSYLDAIRLGAQRGSNLIEGNRLWGSALSDGIQFNPSSDLPPDIQEIDTSNCRVVVRANIIYDNAENGVDLKGACSIVVEGNLVYGSRGDNDGVERFNTAAGSVNDRAGGRAIMHGSNRKSRDVIIRRNIVYDNSGGVMLNDDGWVVYNNTILGNNRDFTGPNSTYANANQPFFLGVSGYGPGNNAVKNNIIGDHFDVETSLSSGARVELDGNLYFYRQAQPTFATSNQPWTGLDFAAWRQAIQSFPNLLGREGASLVVADPRFVNVPARPTMAMNGLDFHLRSDSPAIDKGLPLTSAVGSGSGIFLKVKQPRYFSDGFDIVTGDTLRIGKNQTATIVAVDNAKATLTLDRSIAWNDKDAVTLDYKGSAPDIGAFEYSGTSPPTPPGLIPVGVTASSSRSASEIPQATLDNNPDTLWASIGQGQYIQYDFGSQKTLSQVSLTFLLGDFAPYSTRQYSFEIQTSANGTTFTTIGGRRTSSGTPGPEIYSLPSITTRFVRITLYGSNVNTVNALIEVQFQ